MATESLFGAIEGGGTKFICAIGRAPTDVIDRVTIPTTDAATTLDQCVKFFVAAEQTHGSIAAFGVSCFGPIEVNPGSTRFGHMMATPKPGWSGADVLDPFRRAFHAPIALDTDVGAAALAEWRLGSGRGAGSLVYVTVGTGIGGAAVPVDPAAGRLMHAEMGHMPVRRERGDEKFAGVCPFHGDCLEGLASGPAIRARWGADLQHLPADHESWSIIGGYLGQLAASIALMLSVERIVFGGGVMSSDRLLVHVRAAARRYLNGYLEPLRDEARLIDYICAPALANPGIAGALLLARDAK